MMGAGMSASDDVVFRRDGESFRRSHAIRESGLYRLAPGNYDIWLYDWEFGWVNPADTNEMAPQTPVAPQRGGSKRFWGTLEIKTGEIGTIQVRDSDSINLYRTVAEARPSLDSPDRLQTFLWNTASYTLTSQQADIVQRLLLAAGNRQPWVDESVLLRPTQEPEEGGREDDRTNESSEPAEHGEPPERLPGFFNEGRHPVMAILEMSDPALHPGRRLWRLVEPRLSPTPGRKHVVPTGAGMTPGMLIPGTPGYPPGMNEQRPRTNIEHRIIPLKTGDESVGTAPMVPGGEGAEPPADALKLENEGER
jgi:hypothetical protein